MRSFTTTQGTAMPEATLCEDLSVGPEGHWGDPISRQYAMSAAAHETDWDRGTMHDSTDNDSVACIVCGSQR